MPKLSAEADRLAFKRWLAGQNLSYNQQRVELSAHDRCPEWVHPPDPWATGAWCARAVKSDGLCGIHLAAKKRAVRVATTREEADAVDRRLERALSRIFDHQIAVVKMYGSYRMFVIEGAGALLAEFGVEPYHAEAHEFRHKPGCPVNPTGSTHVGETCKEYITRVGERAPALDDLEEDHG